MSNAPKWLMPVAIVALLWNLLGCLAFAMDALLSADDIAKLSEAERAMYAARPGWSVAATAVAVFGGALGSLGLILRKRWSFPVLTLSLLGVIAQDASFLIISRAAAIPTVALILQGVVLVVAIGLVLLARTGIQRGWLA